MALIVKTLPGVFGGVSNQTESLRKDNQVTEMINCIPSLVLGTTRRANVEEGVISLPTDASFIYDYQRSGEEANILTVATDGSMSAHRVGVGVKPITVPQEVKDYLVHTDPKDLGGITLGDTTYIVNKTQTVGISDVLTSTMPELDDLYTSNLTLAEQYSDTTAYYWLSRGSNDAAHPYRYVVELDDEKYEADNEKPDVAAALLAGYISSNVVRVPMVCTASGSNKVIVSATGGHGFNLESFDSDDNNALTESGGPTSYTITINHADAQFGSYTLYFGGNYVTVLGATIADIQSEFIAAINGKHFELITNAPNTNGYSATAIGSIIRIWKTDNSDFKFSFWDSWGSLASFGWKASVGKLQDLPASFPWDGARVKINSSDGDVTTDYYAIRWKGTWQEYSNIATYENGLRKLPLLNNMPIVIERQGAGSANPGSFIARLLDTSDQLRPPLVGNTENNKAPNFVGKKIKQIFYINGRICLASGDSLSFSQTDVIWNFYASTIINVLPGDTIEVKIASEKILEILRVAIFQSGLLIMTSEGQYLFNTEQGISPATVIVNKLSNYAYNDSGGTVYDGDSIVFSGFTGDTSRIYRYRVARLTSENKAIDLTIQIPTYLKGEVINIANFVEDGTLIVLTKDSKKLYLYREVISGDTMVQSAWFTWDFSTLFTGDFDYILHIMIIDDYLYLITATDVCKIHMGLKVFDESYEHKDLGTHPYPSTIELTKWRPKQTVAQVQTPRGRLQLRTATVSLTGEAVLQVFKEDRDFTQEKPITTNKSINILSNTDKTVLSIINDNTKPFTISGIAYSGTYRTKGKEQI